ncbi:MAG: SAM-dependent methyltransferase [Arenicella sp.]|jgi:SAM-dependent methyltransferase
MKTNKKIQKGNFDFYSAMQLEHFEEFANLTGFDTGIDIEILFPYLKNAETLVELGAGYGRAIHFLLQKEFEGKIIAVERIDRLIPHLQQRFQDKIQLVQQDITKLKLPKKADFFMWLWSGILELNPTEQLHSIKQVYKNLKPGGTFAIESPDKTVRIVGKLEGDRKVTLETEWGALEAYLPTESEIRNYAEQAGFSNFQTIRYQSTVGLDRVFYLLTK